ncbi:MAG TPA: histidine kinase dimerization/phosphoacceptor domain-containing protein, partial [Nitrospira sp.]
MAEHTHGLHVIQGTKGCRSPSDRQRIPSAERSNTAVGSPDTYLSYQSRQDDLTVALRAMEQRLATFIEDRTRLTRDLHDGILQSLYAIGLSIETTRRSARSPSEARRHGGLLVGQLNALIQEVRE